MAEREGSVLWWQNPRWWTVLISGLQLVVIGLIFGCVDRMYQRRMERSAVLRQIGELKAKLADRDAGVYEPAVQALVSFGMEGIGEIRGYAKVVKNSCVPWEKARFFHASMHSSLHPSSDEAETLEMLWNSWGCHGHHIGMDVQLYEALKRDAQATCTLLLPRVEKAGEKSDLVRQGALLATFEDVCPTQQSRELQALRSRFQATLKETTGAIPTVKIQIDIFVPWLAESAPPTGPFEAEESSWSKLVMGLLKQFDGAGPEGPLFIWRQLRNEPLASRLILGQWIAFYCEAGDKSCAETLKELASLVHLGLTSPDPQERKAAVSATGQFCLGEWTMMRRLAEHDEDGAVRRQARNALISCGQM
jgi:hypothetical protein